MSGIRQQSSLCWVVGTDLDEQHYEDRFAAEAAAGNPDDPSIALLPRGCWVAETVCGEEVEDPDAGWWAHFASEEELRHGLALEGYLVDNDGAVRHPYPDECPGCQTPTPTPEG